MKEKITFIEEIKIKKELEKAPSPKTSAHSNPIKANLMKFVHSKNLRNSFFKKDFE